MIQGLRPKGARDLYANPLFQKACSAAEFLPVLEHNFPVLVENYRRRYAGRAFLDRAYRQRISQLMNKLRRKHGITREVEQRADIHAALARPPSQLPLF